MTVFLAIETSEPSGQKRRIALGCTLPPALVMDGSRADTALSIKKGTSETGCLFLWSAHPKSVPISNLRDWSVF